MAHETLNIRITPASALAQADREPESGITSAGGLAVRLGGLTAGPTAAVEGPAATVPPEAEARRRSLGKFVELSRRRLRMTVEQLADRADIDLAELLAIENADGTEPGPRTLYRLAEVLQVPVEPLLELAGLVAMRSTRLTDSAVRFAARSEPMDVLTKAEEEALNLFVRELTKP